MLKNDCSIDTMIQIGKSSHFNFPIWDGISYYPEQIKHYRNRTNLITGLGKIIQIIQIKDLFKQKNMRKYFKKQILDHNIEKINLIVRDDINIFSSIKI